jgi:hypothetical protein
MAVALITASCHSGCRTAARRLRLSDAPASAELAAGFAQGLFYLPSASEARCHAIPEGCEMKIIVCAAAVAAVVFAGTAVAQNAKQDFRLSNKTGYELKAVYVAPSKSDDWEDDVMGQDVLGDGQAVNIHFKGKTNTCIYDLKVVYSDDDSSAVWQKINLCEIEKITIKYDRKSDKTSATFD